MAFNTSNISTTQQQTIDSLTTSSTNESLLLGAMTPDRTAISCSVPTTDDLPDLTVHTDIPNGFIVFVEDIGIPVMSVGAEWQLLNGIPYLPTVKIGIRSWGNNISGQLGDSTTINRSTPVQVVTPDTAWSQVSAGSYHSAAVKSDGTLWTWGYNNNGQLGIGDTTNRSSPGTTAGGGTNWSQVSAGGFHTAAVKTDGTLWVWGNNGYTRLGTGDTDDRSSPVTIAGGGTTWSQVSAGEYHIAAVKTDGTLWTWGRNTSGQLGAGTSAQDRSSPGTTAGGGTTWSQVSAGYYHSAAVKTDGSLWTWGSNYRGQLGTNEGNTANRSSPVTTAGGGTNWSQVSAGGYHTAAVKTDGSLWVWGNNNAGQLGVGNTTSQRSPVTTAGGGTTWSQVSCGTSHTAAIKTDGSLWTWGLNTSYQLGIGTTVPRSSPGTGVEEGTTWIQVSSGASHTMAIRPYIA